MTGSKCLFDRGLYLQGLKVGAAITVCAWCEIQEKSCKVVYYQKKLNQTFLCVCSNVIKWKIAFRTGLKKEMQGGCL